MDIKPFFIAMQCHEFDDLLIAAKPDTDVKDPPVPHIDSEDEVDKTSVCQVSTFGYL